MNCPKCGAEGTRIIDTRIMAEFRTYRRHKCRECAYRFTTVEQLYGYRYVKQAVIGRKKTHE